MDEEKVYHIPDWSRWVKGSTLTDYALCGQSTRGEDLHWFGWRWWHVNCEECLRIAKETGDASTNLSRRA